MRARIVLGTWWRRTRPIGDDIHFNVRLFMLERWRETRRFSPAEGRLLVCLLAASGEPVKRGALVDVLMADDEDGGPDSAFNVLSVTRARLQPQLARFGLVAIADRRLGFSIVDLGRPYIEVAA